MIRKLNLDDLEVYWELWLHALKNDPDSFSSTYEEMAAHDKEWIRQHLVKGDDSFYRKPSGSSPVIACRG